MIHTQTETGITSQGFVANGVTSGEFSYLFGGENNQRRRSDSVYVTGHRVGGVGPVHTAIEGPGANGKPITLSAVSEDGLLISYLNWSSDLPSKNFIIDSVTLPEGVTGQQYMQSLIQADSFYCDCIDYDLFPGIADSYNSNSYVQGLLNYTGGSTSVDLRNYVGGNKPLPGHYFDSSR